MASARLPRSPERTATFGYHRRLPEGCTGAAILARGRRLTTDGSSDGEETVKYGTLPDVEGRVSRLVMGSMVFSTEKQEQTNALLDRFVEAGGTAIDTARIYAKGTSEEAFGAWLQSRGCRDNVVVIGKGAHHDSETLERRVNAAAIHEDIETSLRTMRLDRIDVYILHKDDEDAPVGPVVEALNEEHAAGRIGAFGGSSWTHQRIAEANAYAEAHNLKPFSVSSPNLALAVPNEPMWAGCVSLSGDEEALAWYTKSQFPVFAWSSQARGFFSGRYTPEMAAELKEKQPKFDELTPPERDQLNVFRTYFSEANWERYRRAESLATEKGCTLQQITLAWVLAQPLNLYALIGPATTSELDNSLGALDIVLSEEEISWLNLQKEPIKALA
jgi:aryl-alcohol dehydrogenase-like predicted oxidoreductase